MMTHSCVQPSVNTGHLSWAFAYVTQGRLHFCATRNYSTIYMNMPPSKRQEGRVLISFMTSRMYSRLTSYVINASCIQPCCRSCTVEYALDWGRKEIKGTWITGQLSVDIHGDVWGSNQIGSVKIKVFVRELTEKRHGFKFDKRNAVLHLRRFSKTMNSDIWEANALGTSVRLAVLHRTAKLKSDIVFTKSLSRHRRSMVIMA